MTSLGYLIKKQSRPFCRFYFVTAWTFLFLSELTALSCVLFVLLILHLPVLHIIRVLNLVVFATLVYCPHPTDALQNALTLQKNQGRLSLSNCLANWTLILLSETGITSDLQSPLSGRQSENSIFKCDYFSFCYLWLSFQADYCWDKVKCTKVCNIHSAALKGAYSWILERCYSKLPLYLYNRAYRGDNSRANETLHIYGLH